jgi:putative sigma-54 modulation protein
MMKISVQAIHFHADAKLISSIEQKLNRLSKYFDRAIEAEVMLKLQNTGGAIHEKITEIKLHVPGGWMMDRKTDKSFESAISSSVDTLKRQLIRHKERIADHRTDAA